jgi:DNA-binding CsgD family transcriptional regulator
MAKKRKDKDWSLLRDASPSFGDAQVYLSGLLAEKSLSQKDRMSYTLQLAMAEHALGNIAHSVELLAACDKYISTYGLPEEKASLQHMRALHLINDARFEEAMPYCLRALQMAQQLDIPIMVMRILVACGRVCFRLLMYAEAQNYMTRGLELARSEKNEKQIMLFLYHINEIQREILPPEEAMREAEKLLAYRNTLGKPDIAYVLTCESIAEIAISMNDVKKARQYVQMAQEVRREMKQSLTMLPSHLLLSARVASLENDEPSMRRYLDDCLALRQTHTPLAVVHVHEVLFSHFMRHGALDKAKAELDLMIESAARINTSLSENMVDNCQLKYYEAIGDTAKQLEYTRKTYEHKIRLQQQMVAQRLTHLNAVHQLEISERENELMKKELNHKSQELNLSNHHLQQRNQLLTELRECIDSLRSENSRREVVFQTLFKKIDVAFTKEDNERDIFRAKFDTANAEFVQALVRRYPKLSPAECRICALLHSGFTTKEIATLLSTTQRNVETHRLNIRKKLKLKRSDNLQLILAAVRT